MFLEFIGQSHIQFGHQELLYLVQMIKFLCLLWNIKITFNRFSFEQSSQKSFGFIKQKNGQKEIIQDILRQIQDNGGPERLKLIQTVIPTYTNM